MKSIGQIINESINRSQSEFLLLIERHHVISLQIYLYPKRLKKTFSEFLEKITSETCVKYLKL